MSIPSRAARILASPMTRIVLAIVLVALPVVLNGDQEKWKIGGALLLTLAICSHHFTAMGAVSIIPDPGGCPVSGLHRHEVHSLVKVR